MKTHDTMPPINVFQPNRTRRLGPITWLFVILGPIVVTLALLQIFAPYPTRARSEVAPIRVDATPPPTAAPAPVPRVGVEPEMGIVRDFLLEPLRQLKFKVAGKIDFLRWRGPVDPGGDRPFTIVWAEFRKTTLAEIDGKPMQIESIDEGIFFLADSKVIGTLPAPKSDAPDEDVVRYWSMYRRAFGADPGLMARP
jgi:hypothetical protein